MEIYRSFKQFFIIAFIVVLAGCGSQVAFIKFEPPEKPIKKIGLIPVPEPTAYWAMDWGNPGGVFAAKKITEQSQHFDKVTKQANFKISKSLNAALVKYLRQQGFQLIKIKANRENPHELLKKYPTSQKVDAYLDIVITPQGVGFTTKNAFDRKYRPDLRIAVKLVSAVDSKILYGETFMYGYHNTFMKATNLDAPENNTYENFDALMKNHTAALKILQRGAYVVAKQIAQNLKLN